MPAACVDVGENGAARQDRRDIGMSCCSLSLAAPEFGSGKLYADLGRAAGQDGDNLFAMLWIQRRQQRTVSLVRGSAGARIDATQNKPPTGEEEGA